LIFSSLFVISKTFYQPVREEVRYLIDKQSNKTYVVAAPQDAVAVKKVYAADVPKGALAKALDIKPVEVLVPQDPDFSIVIPKIAANSRILSNVDAANESEYLGALQEGVAHTKGTAFPGEGGHIFMFAHSTDYIWNVGTYNAVFYLLYKVEVGDEVDIFYKGERHVYRVTGTQIVDPSQVEYLTRKTDKELLTLQTCWPPGTTLKRMLVFAEPVANL
jgi:sortase A